MLFADQQPVLYGAAGAKRPRTEPPAGYAGGHVGGSASGPASGSVSGTGSVAVADAGTVTGFPVAARLQVDPVHACIMANKQLVEFAIDHDWKITFDSFAQPFGCTPLFSEELATVLLEIGVDKVLASLKITEENLAALLPQWCAIGTMDDVIKLLLLAQTHNMNIIKPLAITMCMKSADVKKFVLLYDIAVGQNADFEADVAAEIAQTKLAISDLEHVGHGGHASHKTEAYDGVEGLLKIVFQILKMPCAI